MIKGLMYKRLFNWILVLVLVVTISWASYSYVSVKSQVQTFDAAMALLNNLSIDKNPLLVLSSIFNNLFNLAMLQVFIFLISVISLLFLLWFLFRLYSMEKMNALFDVLTEIYNRRAILLGLKHEIDRAKIFNHKLSIAVVDIDYFKKYNDINGHVAGDKVLRKIAKTLDKGIRATDMVGRVGGEEFLLIFPETNQQGAFKICERIRKSIEDLELPNMKEMPSGKITISIGVSEFNPLLHSKRNENLIIDADRRLYVAKLAGRNVVK